MQNLKTGLILLAIILQGCSSSPEKPESPPTIVDVKIAVSANANLDIDIRP